MQRKYYAFSAIPNNSSQGVAFNYSLEGLNSDLLRTLFCEGKQTALLAAGSKHVYSELLIKLCQFLPWSFQAILFFYPCGHFVIVLFYFLSGLLKREAEQQPKHVCSWSILQS